MASSFGQKVGIAAVFAVLGGFGAATKIVKPKAEVRICEAAAAQQARAVDAPVWAAAYKGPVTCTRQINGKLIVHRGPKFPDLAT